MNKLFLMGRLVADPEFSVSQSGVANCKFRIAVDRSYTKQGEEKQSDFFQIISFGKTAEFVNKYFIKGKPILVEGRIQNNNYQDKNGQMQYHNQIIADTVKFTLSDPTRTGNGSQQPVQQNYQPQQGYQGGYQTQPQYQQYNQPTVQNYQLNPTQVQNQQYQADSLDGFEQISDGNLPF